jgi:Flp pilus assembly protein TadD
MRPLFAIAAFVALLASAAVVHACAGGDEPDGTWTLDRKSRAGLAGLPFLSPGNDSRINLQYLMLDAHPQPPRDVAPPAEVSLDSTPLFTLQDLDAAFKTGPAAPPPDSAAGEQASDTMFADGEGTRCVSDARGRQEFAEAVGAATPLSANEKTLLTAARNGLAPTCVKTDTPAPAPDIPQPSSAAQDFLTYLAGANAFYAGDFDKALDAFRKLANSQNAWLREASRYMIGRTLLNKAEIGAFDGLDNNPDPKVNDRASLAASETELTGYLGAYPAGRYAASARGLLRRLYWLGGDQARLAAEYGWRLAHAGEPQANLDNPSLSQEIDSKYLSGPVGRAHDPNLIAVEDLMRLRGESSDKPALSAADLEAQAPDFAGHEALFAFLKAARAYYADGDFAATLKLIGPAPSGPLSPPYLAMSREMLRGQALMASGQFSEAADHWKALLPLATQPWQKEAAELGLAMSWERAGTLNKVFAPDTRIASPRIRGILSRYSAGPILLRQAIADPQSTPGEKALARYFLLFKEATRGHYTGFLRDYVPDEIAKGDAEIGTTGVMKSAVFAWGGANDPYKCPDLKTVIGELAANPKASHGLLCLGDFVRTAGLEDAEGAPPAANELGGAKSIFPGEIFSRGELYKKLVADASTPANDKAYALYRLINCYGPASVNGCGGKDAALPERKAWFQLLKTKYGSTPWARAQTLYW